jgi:HEAT repeat protein
MPQPRDLSQALKNWRLGQASLEEVQLLAADLGNQHFEPGIPVLLELLDHEDPIVRYNAAMSLAFEFHHVPATERLLSLLALDPDDDCRSVAAGALGALRQNTKDRRVLEALGQASLNDRDEYVRNSAYKSLQIVNGVSREEHLQILQNRDLSVNPARVQAILREISG